jgi:CHAT domain-containing protein
VGDEWVGLGHEFLQAGAATVVTSLWPVEDAATAALMDGFYDRLERGESVSTSLRGAARALEHTLPHPWHWASFVALGASAQNLHGHDPKGDRATIAEDRLPLLIEDER